MSELADLQLACFYSITLLAIKSVLLMRFLPAKCPRTQMTDGHITKVVHACGRRFFLMGKFKNFIFWMMILDILATSKAWNKSFENVDFGLDQALFWPNVKGSNVNLGRQLVAVGDFCSTNLILLTNGLPSKSL